MFSCSLCVSSLSANTDLGVFLRVYTDAFLRNLEKYWDNSSQNMVKGDKGFGITWKNRVVSVDLIKNF